jgi:hypothetical protein
MKTGIAGSENAFSMLLQNVPASYFASYLTQALYIWEEVY